MIPSVHGFGGRTVDETSEYDRRRGRPTVAKITEIQVRCVYCAAWVPSPIVFGETETFDTAMMAGNLLKCQACGKMTACNKENIRWRAGQTVHATRRLFARVPLAATLAFSADMRSRTRPSGTSAARRWAFDAAAPETSVFEARSFARAVR